MLNAAPGLFVRGQIDLIAHAGDTLIVRDYKYSTAADALRYQIQMECYALAAADRVRRRAGRRANRRFARQSRANRCPAPGRRKRFGLGSALWASSLRSRAVTMTYPRKPPNAAACHTLGCGYVARCWGH